MLRGMSRIEHAFMPNRIYSPTERRRLARSGTGPRRIDARRVSKVRHPYPGFTRNAVIDMVRLCVAGMSDADFEIREALGNVEIAVRRPMRDLGLLVETVRAHAPGWCVVTVVSSLNKVAP